MNRREQIKKRMEEILSQWLRANGQERGQLLLERIRLQRELEELEQRVAETARTYGRPGVDGAS